MCVTSFCSTCSADLSTSRNWVSCFLSSSCTCFICRERQSWEHRREATDETHYTKCQAKKRRQQSSWFSHRVQICGQFFYGRFQVVYGFKTVLEETEEKARDVSIIEMLENKSALTVWPDIIQVTWRHEIILVSLTCTAHGSTWWGSAAGPLPSWFWSHWLWADTVDILNSQTVWGISGSVSNIRNLFVSHFKVKNLYLLVLLKLNITDRKQTAQTWNVI